jgi:hypothetical protein
MTDPPLQPMVQLYITPDGLTENQHEVVLPPGIENYQALYELIRGFLVALFSKQSGKRIETGQLNSAWVGARKDLMGNDGSGGNFGVLSTDLTEIYTFLRELGPAVVSSTPTKRSKRGDRSYEQDMLFHLLNPEGDPWNLRETSAHFQRAATFITKVLEACFGRPECFTAFIEIVHDWYLVRTIAQPQWRSLASFLEIEPDKEFLGNDPLFGAKIYDLQSNIKLGLFRKIFRSNEFDGLVLQLHRR